MTSKTGYMAAVIFAAACLLRCGADETNEILTVAVPKLEGDIELDGHMRDAAWSKAASFAVNEAAIGKVQAGCETTGKIWRSADALYLGFRCENPYLPQVLKAEVRPRDGAAYGDECLEIFIKTPLGKEPTRQIVLNALGSVYDGMFSAGPQADWNGVWTCATSVARGAWYAEVKIPFADLGGQPESIMINCCRAGYGRGADKWNSAWKAPGYFKPVVKIVLGP